MQNLETLTPPLGNAPPSPQPLRLIVASVVHTYPQALVIGAIFLIAAILLRRFRWIALGLATFGLLALLIPFAIVGIAATCGPCP